MCFSGPDGAVDFAVDGGWGEGGRVTPSIMRAITVQSTPSQTAWALLGLMAAGLVEDEAVTLGARYLARTQAEDGFWKEERFTTTGFPRVFFLRYHGYAKYFPLWAMARYRNLKTGNRRPVLVGMGVDPALRDGLSAFLFFVFSHLFRLQKLYTCFAPAKRVPRRKQCFRRIPSPPAGLVRRFWGLARGSAGTCAFAAGQPPAEAAVGARRNDHRTSKKVAALLGLPAESDGGSWRRGGFGGQRLDHCRLHWR
jgi:Squalene-hopene cyclase C-terminal domain